MHVTLGSSTINVPFGFPSGAIAKAMAASGYAVTSDRVKQLVTWYWDAIDANMLNPMIPGTTSEAMTRRTMTLGFLAKKGVPRGEAAAFIGAMVTGDPEWLNPTWSLAKTVFQDITGTGAQGDGTGFLPALPWKTLILLGIGGAVLYGVATTATRSVLTR